ncbi:hypothetical protein ACJX0J_024952, partial [Zea mays]
MLQSSFSTRAAGAPYTSSFQSSSSRAFPPSGRVVRVSPLVGCRRPRRVPRLCLLNRRPAASPFCSPASSASSWRSADGAPGRRTLPRSPSSRRYSSPSSLPPHPRQHPRPPARCTTTIGSCSCAPPASGGMKALNLVVVGSSPTVGAKCWDRLTCGQVGPITREGGNSGAQQN